jgi:hypothetical protein
MNNIIYNKFDIVSCYQSSFALILMEEFHLPYYKDGVASELGSKPLEILNPEEWENTCSAYIGFCLIKNEHIIITNIKYKYDGDVMEGSIPCDYGTSKLRLTLGLILLAEKWYGKEGFFTRRILAPIKEASK